MAPSPVQVAGRQHQPPAFSHCVQPLRSDATGVPSVMTEAITPDPRDKENQSIPLCPTSPVLPVGDGAFYLIR